MRKNAEVVNMAKFAEPCVVKIMKNKGVRAAQLAAIGAKLMEENGYIGERCYFDSVAHFLSEVIEEATSDKNQLSIITPLQKGESIEEVNQKLNAALREAEDELKMFFIHAKITPIDSKGLFPLLNFEYTLGKIKNIPGGKKVPLGIKVKTGTPFLNLFLPRNSRGKFLNLEKQKVCLEKMAVRPEIAELLRDIIAADKWLENLKLTAHRGNRLTYDQFESGSDGVMEISSYAVYIIKMLRQYLKSRGYQVGEDEPIIHCTKNGSIERARWVYKNLPAGHFIVNCSDVKVVFKYRVNGTTKVTLDITRP